ncbi:hypothetical protein Avbf_15331 [Armadillidium vulgare]|nr:hypothetical protein Avbf_15331 [Armadillidium vulgare]
MREYPDYKYRPRKKGKDSLKGVCERHGGRISKVHHMNSICKDFNNSSKPFFKEREESDNNLTFIKHSEETGNRWSLPLTPTSPHSAASELSDSAESAFTFDDISLKNSCGESFPNNLTCSRVSEINVSKSEQLYSNGYLNLQNHYASNSNIIIV